MGDTGNTTDRKALIRDAMLTHFGRQNHPGTGFLKRRQMLLQERGYDDTVLLVDDEVSHLEIASEILGRHGLRCLTVTSVEQARQTLYSNSDINLIICDLKMPVEDGYVLLQFVRDNLRFQNIPIMVSTAMAFGNHVARAIELGARDYIAKPFSEEILVSRIRRVLQPGKGTILVVTDCDPVGDAVARMITRTGYQVLRARTGREAEQMLSERRASAVLTELVLEDMSGLGLLASIAEHFLDIPVLFFSDPTLKITEEEIIATGAYGLVRKPISGPELVRQIEALNLPRKPAEA